MSQDNDAQCITRNFLKSQPDVWWFPLVEYFLPTLVQDQPFLFRVLSDRAVSISLEMGSDVVHELHRLWDRLKLRLEVTP